MSILVAGSAILALVVLIPIVVVTTNVLRRSIRSEFTDARSCTGCLLTAVCFPILWMACLPVLSWLVSYKATGITFKEASESISLIALPATATDIDVHKLLYETCSVDFSIDEREFVDWCESNGWTLEPILVSMQSWSSQGEPVEIDSGYRFSGGSEEEIMVLGQYDSNRGRVFCSAFLK